MARKKPIEVPEPLDEGTLTIFVDGSMRSSPRRGGIGIRFVWIDEAGGESEPWDHALPATEGATISQMELEAPYRALQLAMKSSAPFRLSDFDRVEIRTDSEYVKEGVRRAINYWSKNGWNTRDGKAVDNVSDWKNLLRIMKRFSKELGLPVRFEWKQGKKGKHAKAVDKLAKQSSAGPSFGQTRPTVVRRKTTSERVEPGSVGMQGQEVLIRVIQARYLPPPHSRTRYRYEVVDENSLFNGKVDWAESNLNLKRGHTYRVRMGTVQTNPWIEQVLEEVEEDLRIYLEVVKAVGEAVSAQQVAEELSRREDVARKPDAIRRRLDRLVETGDLAKSRSSGQGRPYLYDVPSREL